MVEAVYDLCRCNSCNCINLTLTIEDDGLFEPESEEFAISLSSQDYNFYSEPIVVEIKDNDGRGSEPD